MKILIILLLFFSCLNVSARTITTPFLKVGEVDAAYKANANEKIEVITYYNQEKINKDYKYLEKPNNEYSIKSDEITYGPYSAYQEKRLYDKSLEEQSKTIYYYQALKKIDYLNIKNIKNLLITNITLKYKDNVIYEGNDYKIKLSKKYSPEYLNLEVTCFLNQGDMKGEFTVENSDYINEKVEITDKGFNNINIKLINHLTKTIYDNKVLKTENIENKFYINIIDKKVLYRYRRKYYKFYKNENIIDTKINDGYKVIDAINKYYLYRKESIELFDNIVLSNYLDLSKIIKSSTIPLNKLEFNYSNNCSTTVLTIKYQDFIVETNVTFTCQDYEKSKVTKGKTKSLKREIFSILFKVLFLQKL